MSDDARGEELSFPASSCFGCSTTNPVGLRLRFFRQGDEVVSRYRAHAHLCGAPGIVHGGILATIIDEVSCAAAVFVRGTHAVTGELTVRYLAPCPVEQDIEIRARIAEEHPRYLVVEAEVLLASEPLARSTGRFFPTTRPVSAADSGGS